MREGLNKDNIMTKSDELKLLAKQALNGENIDKAAGEFMDKHYPETTSDTGDSILEGLNGAYIARRFFGKSRFWYSQKVNNNTKNGKPTDFTEEEWSILKNAMITMSNELRTLADNM